MQLVFLLLNFVKKLPEKIDSMLLSKNKNSTKTARSGLLKYLLFMSLYSCFFSLKYLALIALWMHVLSKSPMVQTLTHFLSLHLPSLIKFSVDMGIFAVDHCLLFVFSEKKTNLIIKSFLCSKIKDTWFMKQMQKFGIIEWDSKQMKALLFDSESDNDGVVNETSCEPDQKPHNEEDDFISDEDLPPRTLELTDSIMPFENRPSAVKINETLNTVETNPFERAGKQSVNNFVKLAVGGQYIKKGFEGDNYSGIDEQSSVLYGVTKSQQPNSSEYFGNVIDKQNNWILSDQNEDSPIKMKYE